MESNNFKVTIKPQVQMSDFIVYDVENESNRSKYEIDPNWFEQISFVQNDDQSTTLIVDFNISGTQAEIHDCFCSDFLVALKSLGRHNRRNYIANSEKCTIEYYEKDYETDIIHTVWIENNKIKTEIIRNNKIELYGEYDSFKKIQRQLESMTGHIEVSNFAREHAIDLSNLNHINLEILKNFVIDNKIQLNPIIKPISVLTIPDIVA